MGGRVRLRTHALALSALLAFPCAGQPSSGEPTPAPTAGWPGDGFAAIGDPAGSVELRLGTNGFPEAPHLFNTIAISAYGRLWVAAPPNPASRPTVDACPPGLGHNLLINDRGPNLGEGCSLSAVERASGAEWSYLGVDATAAYQDRLQRYRRGILFVKPDLLVVHDHLVAKEPVSFRLLVYPPKGTTVDPVWHDLRLDDDCGGLRIHLPARQGSPRAWEAVNLRGADPIPGYVAMAAGPTNHVTQLDVLTVFVVYPRRPAQEYAFKLLESQSAVGARIHRNGLPVLVAFRTSPAGGEASLTGFPFHGPVGVDIFRPKPPRQPVAAKGQ